MPGRVFADTQYWVALIRPADQWAIAASQYPIASNLVTTDEVLVEFLGFVSSHGPYNRSMAVEICRSILARPEIEVVSQSRSTFLRGLDLYEARADKGYSLVDCVSMVTMREMGIEDVLTADQHFTQEGFNRLLA